MSQQFVLRIGLVLGVLSQACGILTPTAAEETSCNWIHLNRLEPAATPSLVIAHRGFAGCFPENTLEAIRGARALGVPVVEVDIWLTADTVPVLMHDSTVTRTTGGIGWVRDLSLSEIRQLNACPTEPTPCGVPTLAEALAAAGPDLGLLLDMKGGFPGTALDRVITTINDAQANGRTTLLTGSMPLLRRTRRDHPDVACIFVYADTDAWEQMLPQRIEDLRALGVGQVVVFVRDMIAYPNFASTLSVAGIELVAATVTTREEMRFVRESGVFNVLSDVPVKFDLITPPHDSGLQF